MRHPATLLFLTAILFASASLVTAQPSVAPSIRAAEEAFDRGLRAFSAGQFQDAHDAFTRAATHFEFNQRTTAAYLMAGKALYASGDFEGASSAMTSLVASYPRSRYVAEAREIRREAMARMRDRPPAPTVTSIGITLPLASRDAPFSQALFNGIRIAIDEHNAVNPERPIRMVFRDSGGTSNSAGDAVSSLAREGAAVVIGPLYTEEASAAGAAAERERIVLVSPMATGEEVSRGRSFVFQANPTFPARGSAIARYAREAGHEVAGVVAAEGTLAEDMAEAFRSTFERIGGHVEFVERLPSEEAWFQLSERMNAESFRQIDVVYFPITGPSAVDHAAAALRGLDQLLGESNTRLRVLGNQEWLSLPGPRDRAARYRAIVTTDYHVGTATGELRGFTNQYFDLAGVLPDRLAFKGYDLTRMLLKAMAGNADRQELADRLRRAEPHQGLGHRIHFGGEQVNQHLYFLRYEGSEIVLDR